MTPADEIKYHRGMAKFMAERGYMNLAESHVIAMLEAVDSVVKL